MLCSRRLLTENVLKHIYRPRVANKTRSTGIGLSFYSNRSNYENQDVYKAVKSRKSVEEVDEFSSDMNSNWELLSPQGYRFYLPGNVGPAWHDQYSTAQFTDFNDVTDGTAKTSPGRTLECVAQACPLLLRKGVFEMFPAMGEMASAQLTIVTLSEKYSVHLASHVGDSEQENQVKMFVLVAQEICLKLNLAGYWADFINPFSGRPYLSASYKTALYKTDERFRCLGFEITTRNNCKVIDNQQNASSKFVGSLFTTAPANMTLLNSIINKYDD